MNKYNHFLASFNALFILFGSVAAFWEIIIFSLIFGAAIDYNQKIGMMLGKPLHHRRTWIEEPFGVVLIGLPIGLLLGMVREYYLYLVIVPYALHVVLDYLNYHEVSPFAPFSGRTMMTGFFRAEPKASWYTGKERGISENYFLAANIAILALSLLAGFLVPR